MKTINIPLIAIALLVGALAGGYLFVQNLAFGSVTVGQEYRVNQLTSADIGTTTLRTMFGGVGSIVVASSSGAQNIAFYDTAGRSTTTSATTTLIMTFDASANEGTYQLDVAFDRGLLIDVPPGFNGNILMTYR